MNVVPAKQKFQRACIFAAQQQWRICAARFHTSRRVLEGPPVQTTEAEIQSAQAYCTNLIRTHDRPVYTLLPFIPPAALRTHLALRALHIALCQIPSQTSNAAIGALRIQFWRDAITAALNLTPKKEPITLLLSSAASTLANSPAGQTRLSKPFLQRLITAHTARLHHPPMPDLAALETHAEHTHATLLYLTLQALPPPSLAVDHVASHIGKAQGLVAALRSIPALALPQAPPRHHSNPTGTPPPLPTMSPSPAHAHHGTTSTSANININTNTNTSTSTSASTSISTGTVPLPLATMAAASLREEDVFRHAAAAPGLRDAVFAVATRAHDHLRTARDMAAAVLAGRGEGHAFEHAGERDAALREAVQGRGGGGDSGGGGGGGGDDAVAAETAAEMEAETGAEADARALRRAFGVLMAAQLPAQMWLEALEKVDFDVFAPRVAAGAAGEWKLPWKAYWAFRRRQL